MGSQPSKPEIRVFVANSSPLHCQLLAEAIRRGRHFSVVGSTASVANVIQSVLECRPDVLLIGANLEQQPNRGLSVLRELQANRPNLKAVVLLDSSTPNTVVQAFLSGARGVFCRSVSLSLLSKCIRVVHDGQIWANSQEVEFLLAALAAPSLRQFEPDRLSLLSERECAVVRCLAFGGGGTNRDIAQQLGISDHTVKNYMLRIFDKIGVSSRVELLFYVLSHTGATYNNEANTLTGGAARRPRPEPMTVEPVSEAAESPQKGWRHSGQA